MPRFSEQIKGADKVWNHPKSKAAKVDIRERVLEAVGREAQVFDAFAGPGEMFRAVWNRCAGYVACDQEWFRDGRPAYVADNARVMRSIDLSRFSIFDFDAFGSPWQQVLILAARREVEPGERIGVVLTDGSGLKLKQGDLPTALAQIAGFHGRPAGLIRGQDEIITRAIHGMCRRMNCTLEYRWEAHGKTGAGVRYIGLVLVRPITADDAVNDVAGPAADSHSQVASSAANPS